MILKTLDELSVFRSTLTGGVVVTNGCFDIIHIGHVRYLTAAKAFGRHLIVGLNGDQSVRMLKGEGRPINPESHRAIVLEALKPVDCVCIFHGMRCPAFLRVARPDVYVKGGDYSLETLDPDEKAALNGSVIRFIPMIEQVSTTNILSRV